MTKGQRWISSEFNVADSREPVSIVSLSLTVGAPGVALGITSDSRVELAVAVEVDESGESVIGSGVLTTVAVVTIGKGPTVLSGVTAKVLISVASAGADSTGSVGVKVAKLLALSLALRRRMRLTRLEMSKKSPLARDLFQAETPLFLIEPGLLIHLLPRLIA